jgi:hypothetical protein
MLILYLSVNDYDNKVALAYYLNARYETANWHINDEKQGAALVVLAFIAWLMIPRSW